jgi:hypothetical protein
MQVVAEAAVVRLTQTKVVHQDLVDQEVEEMQEHLDMVLLLWHIVRQTVINQEQMELMALVEAVEVQVDLTQELQVDQELFI